MKVCDIMSDKVVAVSQQEPIAAAARLMKRHNLGALPVCDEDGRLRGIITDRDIVTRCVAVEMDPETKVREIMSRGICSCGTEENVDNAAKTMSDEQVRRLPVLDNGRVVGMVSLCDLARNSGCNMEAAAALSDISANIRRR